MASTTHWRNFNTRRKTMRKLSYLFMTLSGLCFAMPAFAQGGTMTDASWVAITAGFSMAIASAVCGLAQGKATGSRNRGTGSQSSRKTGHPVRPAAGTGADRIARPLHAGDYLLEGE